MKYENHFNQSKTAQSEPIPGKNQVKNSAGGYSFAVDAWTKLDRFLILGTEGGSYYATERQLTQENAQGVAECIKIDGLRTVRRIAEISDSGRAPKNDPAIFALAMASKLGDESTRRAAREIVSRVCRTGTHLFAFARAIEAFGGWGRGTRNAVASWYSESSIEKLMYQVVKYQQRDGWSHRDLLRLSHPKTKDPTRNTVFKWITRGDDENDPDRRYLEGSIIHGFEWAKVTTDVNELIAIIEEFKLPHECVPTQFKNDPRVQEILLKDMGYTAMIRNLGNMTKSGLLVPLSSGTGEVIKRLGNAEAMARARIHPIQVLTALLTYKAGRGMRGNGSWTPVPSIVDALDAAFYESFKHVEPTGKRIMLALDVSGSMSGGMIAGVQGLTPRIGAAAMAMALARVEKNNVIVSFQDRIVPLDISPRMSLDAVVRATSALPFGSTDCAQPMIYAKAKKLNVDAFVVLTDSETWHGNIHPCQALKDYRKFSGIPAKSVVVGMIANDFSIADPGDSGMMDVVGFDTNVPSLISDFMK